MTHRDPLDQLTDKFTIGDDCWEWTAFRDPRGYGRVNVRSGSQMAHRALYELLVGPVPAGFELDHLCRNHGCVNPDHLEPVTHAVNVLRGESWSARNTRKTHCPKGHPYDEENTRITVDGGRRCRTCHREEKR